MEYAVIALAVVIIIVMFMIGGVLEERRKKAEFIKKLHRDYGKPSAKQYPEGRMQTIAGYAMRRKTGFMLDDITWNDLDMDRIFQMMDFTYSAAGEEYLYAMLRSPRVDGGSFEKQEELVTYFMEQEQERIRLQLLFARIGRTGRYSIMDYLDGLEALGVRSSRKHYILLFGFVLSAALCVVIPPLGAMGLAACILSGIISYFHEKSEIMPYLTTFSYLLRLLQSVSAFEELKIGRIREEVDRMKVCRNNCRRFYRGSFLVTSMNQTSSNPAEIVMDYIKMIFHVDLIKFNQMLREAISCREQFLTIFEITGRLEAYISIGAYRSSAPLYTVPVLDDRDDFMTLKAEEMVHPLLPRPVANSFSAERGILLTGSNASGKSTFLKMVAVNAILAQSVHTVLAKSYQASVFRIYTSMALRDDLSGGESYFIVEIKAIKRIIDAAGQTGVPVLCFVDEVLRGTNTAERIGASCEILKGLSGERCLCFAATHDMELTELLQEQFDNYHFEETVADGDVLFNYRLKRGKATTRNAIQLLRVLGFREDIIRQADRRVEIFMDKGVWKA